MSDAIKGSKSSLYIKEEVPGVLGSSDTIDHVSVQNLWGGRGALDVVIHAYYVSNLLPLSIEAGSVRRKIKITNHGAVSGDVVRMSSGGANSEEVSILKIIDTDWFVIAKEINASVGDNCDILKPVSPTYNKDGSLNVSSGPVSYNDIQAGTVVEATADSITPANNKAVPNGMYIKKDDGNWYPVTLDQTNPFQHTPIPVAITDVLGNSNVNVDLAGSTLNVSIKHDSLDPSSVRIGDGVNVLEINGANEAAVHDADVLVELVTLNAVDFSTEAKQDSIITQLTTLNSVDFSTEAKQDATNTKLDTLIAKDFATQTTLAALLSELQLKADLTETQPVSIQNASIAVTGPLTDTELRATAVPVSVAGVSTSALQTTGNTSLNNIDNKLPSALGQNAVGDSLSIVQAIGHTFSVAQAAVGSFFVESNSIGSGAATALLNGVTCKKIYIQADETNTVNLRFKITNNASAATTTSGFQLQPGRDFSFDLGGSSLNCTLSIIAESGSNQKVMVIYGN